MKKLILTLAVILSFNSCSQSENNEKENLSLIGTWKLIESYSSDGGNTPSWKTVENGYIYTFNSDGSFTSNRFSECTKGNYKITDNKLTLTFDCAGFNTGIENSPGVFIEELIYDNTNMILKPTYLTCIEGCGFKFQKN
ncbi:lipocalin family protein [Polaribacter sp.]|uniref:lipocalin family protein n=1 Tax=Polaribacter sp. TaxID=1920175 RepID=UPI004047A405